MNVIENIMSRVRNSFLLLFLCGSAVLEEPWPPHITRKFMG